MRRIRLIALDLDGTLLNSRKELTEENRAALAAAAEAGIEIVPATGRFRRGMPEAVRELPFVRRCITINGASVLDVRDGTELYEAKIAVPEALELLEYLDTLPVIYDSYIDGWGYMTEAMQRSAEEYIRDARTLEMVRTLRSPVPELKETIREWQAGVQKVQLFTKDDALREALRADLAARFPKLAVTGALPDNLEINSRLADKGAALLGLARSLGIRQEETMAFGDGLNDLTMLRAAGVAVAMRNGRAEVLAEADLIAPDCDSDGVAEVIRALLDGSLEGSPLVLQQERK